MKVLSLTAVPLVAAFAALTLPAAATAATITFDTLVTGQTSFGFDGDGDGINDVVFSTTDPSGFNTIGPGLSQLYISEPGLEGTTALTVDLRVDFLTGATQSVSFGFALSQLAPSPDLTASLSLFNSSGALLGTATTPGAIFALPGGDQSTFIEGVIAISFAGTASYGLFSFGDAAGRHIIDNFSGNFGSVVPEPATVVLMGLGLAALVGRASRRR